MGKAHKTSAQKGPRASRLRLPSPTEERRRPGPKAKDADRNRSERIPVLVRPREKTYIFNLADTLGMAGSEYLRFAGLALAKLHEAGVVDLAELVEENRGLQDSNLWPSAPEAD